MRQNIIYMRRIAHSLSLSLHNVARQSNFIPSDCIPILWARRVFDYALHHTHIYTYNGNGQNDREAERKCNKNQLNSFVCIVCRPSPPIIISITRAAESNKMCTSQLFKTNNLLLLLFFFVVLLLLPPGWVPGVVAFFVGRVQSDEQFYGCCCARRARVSNKTCVKCHALHYSRLLCHGPKCNLILFPLSMFTLSLLTRSNNSSPENANYDFVTKCIILVWLSSLIWIRMRCMLISISPIWRVSQR